MSEAPMIEQVELGKMQPKVEQKPVVTGDVLVKSADETFLSRLEKFPEKARHVLRLSARWLKSSRQQIALTAAALPVLAACNFGSAEKQNVPPPPTPTAAVAELPEGMPSSTIKFSPTSEAPLATPVIVQRTPSPTPEPKPSFAPIPEPTQVLTLIPRTVTPEEPPTSTVKPPELSEKDLNTQFMKEMKLKYGIDIKIGTVFFDMQDPSPEFAKRFNLDEQPKKYLSKLEINTLSDAFIALPFCPQLVEEVIIDRLPSERNPQNDHAYLGGFHHPKEVKGDKNSITFFLSNNLDLSSPTLDYNKLGIKTYKDLLKQVFFHECGHRISNMVLSAAYSEDEYLQIMNPGRLERDYLEDKKNPLFVAFSLLEDWQTTEAFQQDLPREKVYVKPIFDGRMVYRPTQTKIEEHFAELWSLYVGNSPVLTTEEKKFFQKINDGLTTDAQKFVKEVAKNPKILLTETLD